MSREYQRVQAITMEQLVNLWAGEVAHLSQDEQISLAISAATTFNNVAADMIKERDEEKRAAQETGRDDIDPLNREFHCIYCTKRFLTMEVRDHHEEGCAIERAAKNR